MSCQAGRPQSLPGNNKQALFWDWVQHELLLQAFSSLDTGSRGLQSQEPEAVPRASQRDSRGSVIKWRGYAFRKGMFLGGFSGNCRVYKWAMYWSSGMTILRHVRSVSLSKPCLRL